MKKLMLLPALFAAALALGACTESDDPPYEPGPVTTATPSEVTTSVPVVVPSSGKPSVSLSPTTTVVPSVVPADPSCGPADNDCGNGADKANDGK